MNIVQINTKLEGGGAEKLCSLLHEKYLLADHNSFVAVGNKSAKQKKIIHISPKQALSWRQKTVSYILDPFCSRASGLRFLGAALSRLRDIVIFFPRYISYFMGREIFYYPASRKILERVPQSPDILHAHNLHGGYFDLSLLPYYSKKIPFLITLHDNWLLTGHCACFLECGRWERGCGKCPDLKIYPAIRKDATIFNWRRKRNIYAKSFLYIAAPSQWMLDCLGASMLAPFVRKARLIPNGVSHSIFRPRDKGALRQELDLPRESSHIFMFVAQGLQSNPFKDYNSILQALRLIAQDSKKKVIFIGIGGDRERSEEIQKDTYIRHVPYVKDAESLAKYYACADLYLHAAKAENMPLSILEALSCGTPVVATKVGGIPEIIEDGANGFLVPKRDAKGMAQRALEILGNEKRYRSFRKRARESAVRKYSLDKMAEAYIDYYAEIIKDFHSYSCSYRSLPRKAASKN